MNKVETDVFNRYLEVKQDLVNHLYEVFNKQHTYTHKYRGNLITDINVALSYGAKNEKVIQIFIRHKEKWIKDVLSIYDGVILDSNITTNIDYNE